MHIILVISILLYGCDLIAWSVDSPMQLSDSDLYCIAMKIAEENGKWLLYYTIAIVIILIMRELNGKAVAGMATALICLNAFAGYYYFSRYIYELQFVCGSYYINGYGLFSIYVFFSIIVFTIYGITIILDRRKRKN